jgi:3-hydroxyacyl-[acyl-carrier-protein] dehydratase
LPSHSVAVVGRSIYDGPIIPLRTAASVRRGDTENIPVRAFDMILSRTEIQQVIPHREPFMLVDEIVELDAGKSALGIVRDVAAYDFYAQALGRHRPADGLILVDSIRLDSPPATAEGLIEDVSALRPFFTGHFPETPIFPGVLTLEALAEVAHHLLVQSPPFDQGTFLKRIDDFRFRRVVVPGDRVELRAEHTDPGVIRSTATVGGSVAAEGRLTFVPESPGASPGPGEPTLPGQATSSAALIIEALAEVGAVAVLSAAEQKGRIAVLASINDWEFHAPVPAGRRLTLRASLVESRRSFGKGYFAVASAEGPVAEGYLVFGLGD